MKRSTLMLAALALLLGGVGQARAGLLYDQPPIFPDRAIAWTSSVDPNGQGFQTYDNFTLAQSSAVAAVNWQGYYRDFITHGNNPVQPDTTTWRIQFYSSVANLPG